MLPNISGGHTAYQNFVVENLRKYYPNPNKITRSTWDIIDRFWRLDLSYIDSKLIDTYSKCGPTPRTPSDLHRSYLLSLDFKVTGITDWVAQLRINPLYAILSGFEVDNTPGIGTFYDFINRLWNCENPNLSEHVHPPKAKIKNPTKDGAKAKPIDKTTVEDLFRKYEDSSHSFGELPFQTLFDIYNHEFLAVSADKGLIDLNALSLAGDGSPVVTSARIRKKRICNCFEKGILHCDCNRHYSQPDCDIGWDSSRKCNYHGYHLYMLAASDSESDLPVFAMLNPASTHDSHGFLHTFFRMKHVLSDVTIKKLLLDAAHDAMPYYLYCKRKAIVPFIDLNEKRGINLPYKNDFTIGKDGVPICKEGHHMNHDGSEPSKFRLKFRCPLASRKTGCSCPNPCSKSKYGRTVHLAMKDNPRIINMPSRDSKEWKTEFNARTSVERSNKREKIDFLLENGRHRSSKMWYCRLYHIMMLQHLDAWDLPYESALRKLILHAA